MTAIERWQRLSALFDECIDLDETAQAARIDALRGDDPALAAELARLLAADRTESGLVDGSLADHVPTLVGRMASRETMEGAGSPGRRIGPFRLIRLLGRGGMGEVWLAERADSDFEQQVALKLLKRGMDSLEILARFERERRILASLDHPDIARFVDGGLSDDGLPWFAMEYVEGETITEYASQHGLDIRARVALMVRVCEAVAYAQMRLIVHRDLKPSNILIDREGRPRLLDFGIAKLLQDGAGDDQTRTQVRALSPAYAAPEQILDQPVGMATDVYSLGVVLYQLISGRLPQRRDALSIEALSQQITDQEIMRPSLAVADHPGAAGVLGLDPRDLARQARQVSGDLDVVTLNALRHDPARRYSSAAALAEDLHAWLERRPVRARPDSVGYRTRRFMQRHAVGVTASAGVLLALLVGLGAALWQADAARKEAARADREAIRALEQAEFAEAQAARAKRAIGFLVSVFKQADPLRGDGRGAMTLDEAFEGALERIENEFNDDPALKADLLDDFGEILAGKGRFDEARDHFERALALALDAHGEHHPAVAESLVNLGAIENYRGNILAGRSHLERAMPILEAFADREPRALITGRVNLAAIANAEGRQEDALALLVPARDSLRQHFPEDLMHIAQLDLNLGRLLQNLGRYREAQGFLEQAAATAERLGGGQSALIVPVLESLSMTAFLLGEHQRAADLDARRLERVRSIYPGDHPWHASALVDQGVQMERRGEDGISLLEAGAAMYARLGSPDEARARAEWAESLMLRGDADAATAVLEVAESRCAALEQEPRICKQVALAQARLWLVQGRFEMALEKADANAAEYQRMGSARTRFHARAVEIRGLALIALGRRAEGLESLRDAVATYDSSYGPGHRVGAAARRAMAEAQAH